MADCQIIETLAKELGVHRETRRKWRERRSVPHRWRLPLLMAAEKRGVKIDLAAFDDYRAKPLGRDPNWRPAPSRAKSATAAAKPKRQRRRKSPATGEAGA